MVSLLNTSLIGLLLLYVVVFAQSASLLETSNEINDNRSPMGNEQLYELYKAMRTDPRLASASNQDIVAYIYRSFVLANDSQFQSDKPKYPNYRRHRQQQQQQQQAAQGE
jgi:hypothetical protein